MLKNETESYVRIGGTGFKMLRTLKWEQGGLKIVKITLK